MNLLDARTCSLLDCVAGTVFVAAAFTAASAGGGVMVWLPLGLGLALPALTLVADDRAGPGHPLSGAARHDIALVAATLLALSPWLLAFADVTWRPHLIAGQVGIGIAILTRRMAELREAPPGWVAALNRPAPTAPPPRPAPRRYGSGAPCDRPPGSR